MSDWEYLFDMHNEGYSRDQIVDAASLGFNPFDVDLTALGLCPGDWEIIGNNYIEANPELKSIFESLVANAETFYKLTNRYLQIWGELGELYAEIKYGIKRHKPHTEGSDGRLGNDLIEIKTISPEKKEESVRVKRSGNFNKLLIVKISQDFTFKSKLIARKELKTGEGTHAKVSWGSKHPTTLITKQMVNSPDAKIYAALKFPTYLDRELQDRLGLSDSEFKKAVNDLTKSKKIKRSLENHNKWVRNSS